ncbi:hypothetical protein [Clostridium sp.]|uniref:hypothetical protein n=1 Tax=Clostridium sp. TaxID=1506 RepID=UPI003F68B34E
MTSASTRKVFGRTVAYSESDFLSEISPELKEVVSERKMNLGSNTANRGVLNGVFGGTSFNSHSLPSFGARKAEQKINSMLSDSNLSQRLVEDRKKGVEGVKLDEVTPGRKVKHDKFGIGTIVSASKTSNDVKITVAFDNMGIKQLMFSMAPIKLI